MAQGFQETNTNLSDSEQLHFIILRMISNISTTIPCKIMSIPAEDGPFVYDVLPLVNYLDAQQKPITPPTLFNVISLHNVGNNAGVIIEYAINDIVLVGFCHSDITGFKNTQGKVTNPATRRKHDLADGIILSGTKFTNPSVYVKITQDAIDIKKEDSTATFYGNEILLKQGENSEVVLTANEVEAIVGSNYVAVTDTVITAHTTGIAQITAGTLTATATTSATITAPIINLTGNVVISGTLTVAGIITAGDLLAGGVDYTTHKHVAGTLTSPSGAVSGDTGHITS